MSSPSVLQADSVNYHDDMTPRPPTSRAFAAFLAVAVTFTSLSLFVRDTRNVEYYTTQIGEQRPLPLRDGSIITLNTDSTISVRRDGPILYVRLFRGEAHFNMVPGQHRRLIVSVGDRVEVIDTATIFDVRLTDSGAVVTVKEGHVEISIAHLAHVQLIQEHQATIDMGPTTVAVRPQKVSPREVDRQLAWLEGYLDFQCESLGNAAKEFNRYNLTKIEVIDEPTSKVQIGGMFSTSDPVTFADAVSQVMPSVKVDSGRNPDGTRVLRLEQEQQSSGARSTGCTSDANRAGTQVVPPRKGRRSS